MNDEIAGRIERLSPEARALFTEVEQREEEWEFSVPPDELVVDLRQRMAELPPEDQREFIDLFRVIARDAHEERNRLEGEALQAEGFVKLIERAQELDRQAGRPVREDMTLGEALARLEEAGQ
jgi:NADH:ubiquinone oxidoreductase subunit C